jgi:hypothetical protein
VDEALARCHPGFEKILSLSHSRHVIVDVPIPRRAHCHLRIIRCRVQDSLVEVEKIGASAESADGLRRERNDRLAQITHRKWDVDLISLVLGA